MEGGYVEKGKDQEMVKTCWLKMFERTKIQIH